MSDYKQTAIGLIPKEWEVVKLGDEFKYIKTYSNSRADLDDYSEINYIHYGDIHTKFKYFIDFRESVLPKIHLDKLPQNINF
ncbi:restriction endonuclease subunit S [Campylobacter fetus subsp. venerealis]|uniref:hypothetical protein n=1 Tax=Campylobacter fetus TaxID=196 RepID=UPI0018E87D6A|nr:hypothetical protein [Campylobacter fetus]QQF51390.1 restriction endonuclease subunit S [Campylobacter fetus subsp. venerealis]